MRSPAASARSIVIATMAGVLVAIALTTSVGASASSYTTTAYAARLLALVNDARQQHGERPLTLTSGTTDVAWAWTQHLAAARALSHNPHLAHDLSTHGSQRWLTYGENVGMGDAEDPDGLFDAYMSSPEHRANILNGDYRYVGVSVLFTGSRSWNTFDFVDAYRTAPLQSSTHRRAQPAVTRRAAVAPHSVAHAAATASTPPVRPSQRAARPAGPVVVHVEALRHHAPAHAVQRHVVHRQAVSRRPVAALWAESSAAVPVAAAAPVGGSPASHQPLIAVAAAVLLLAFGSRRWLLVATRRTA